METDQHRQSNVRFFSRFIGACSHPLVAAAVASVLAFILYALTVSSSWGFVDGGELSGVAATLGIAHPTGYPTTTLLGHIALLLSPADNILTLNILAAFFTAVSVGLMTLLGTEVLRLVRGVGAEDVAEKIVQKELQKNLRKNALPSSTALTVWSAALGSALAGTGLVWWSQGTNFEVYAFHLAAMILTAYLFLRFVEEERGKKTVGFTRRGMFFALTFGLACTTHVTIVFWIPAYIFYYFGRLGFNRQSFIRLLYLLPGAAAGLLPYLYLPIRAAADPALNWTDPDTLSRFIEHVSGAMFRDVMFPGGDVFSQQTSWFLHSLPAEFAWGGLLLALLGLVTLFRTTRLLAIWSLLVLIVTMIWSGNYGILDVEPYYLPAIIIVALWSIVGLNVVGKKIRVAGMIALGVLLIGLNITLHYVDADKSRDHYAQELTANVLEHLPPNALIISDDWDFWLSGSLYAQYAEGFRTDVTVLYLPLLQYEWYRDGVKRRNPELMGGLENVTDAYGAEFRAFKRGEKSQEGLTPFFQQMINGIIDNAIASRPVFVSGGIDPVMGGAYERVPNFLALRLLPPDQYLPQEFPTYRQTSSSKRIDPYIAMVQEQYARSLVARGLYEEQYGQADKAREYYRAALTFDPGYSTEDLPDFPLNGEDQIGATESFFQEIRKGIR